MRKDYILGLDITMSDAILMKIFDSLGYLIDFAGS
jgi:hypothetical protein